MLNNIGKNLNLCLPKIKLGVAASASPQQLDRRPNPSSVDAFTNFNSLYDLTVDSHYDVDSTSDSDADAGPITPDLTTAFASQRFFCSSPGLSNSIIDSSISPSSSSSSSAAAAPPPPDALVGGAVPIPTYSPDPFNDFRRSMQEMVEARDLVDVSANCDRLHELLSCYLSLNPKSTHKFIVEAFADLLVSLMSPPPPAAKSPDRKSDSSGQCT
ncbi:transcription repressor OFP12-like [Diospyros lotus]|uniref:transcription repressor OFP12-like n=1 Tax=Diospyros lotus TaxID=55363 RepID=UPI002255ED29|nr:transcription repressor OFP12-like [Diospyros lotus]